MPEAIADRPRPGPNARIRRGLAPTPEIESRATPALLGTETKTACANAGRWVAMVRHPHRGRLVTDRTPVHDGADAVLTLYELTATAIELMRRPARV